MIDRAETAHPAPLDVALGRNIRTRRKSLGITQAGLGDAVGLTFQQIQKYERGTNRVSFSKLVEISKALNCRVGSLIDGLEPGDARPDLSEESGQALATAGALELLELYRQIRLPRLRRALITVTAALASTPEGEPDSAKTNSGEPETPQGVKTTWRRRVRSSGA